MKRKQTIKPVSENPMPLKIGVMGGAGSDIPSNYLDRATRLGEEIAAAGCIVITGACPGLPLAAARGASSRGGTVIGISPALSLDEHAYHYGSPSLAHHVLIFTGSGLMGREVVNIHSSNVVFVGGSSGTLPGLTMASLFLPADEVGGDYYDVISLSDGTVLLCVWRTSPAMVYRPPWRPCCCGRYYTRRLSPFAVQERSWTLLTGVSKKPRCREILPQ